jgi:GT2 family glycosyltransferase
MTNATALHARVDVVIPAKNEARRISLCLDALYRESSLLAAVVVVDTGSFDCTREIIRSRQRQAKTLRLQECPECTVATARNLAISETTAEFLLFLDAHTVLDSEWITTAVSLLSNAAPDVAAVLGPLRYSCSSTTVQRYFSEFSGFSPERFFENFLSGEHSPFPWAPTGAVLYRRSALAAVGGFAALDELEDIDLSWRLVLQGYRFEYSEALTALHFEDRSYLALVRRFLRYSRGTAELAARFSFTASSNFSFLRALRSGMPVLAALAFWIGPRWANLKTKDSSGTVSAPKVHHRNDQPQSVRFAHRTVASVFGKQYEIPKTTLFWKVNAAATATALYSTVTEYRVILNQTASQLWWNCIVSDCGPESLERLASTLEISTTELRADLEEFVQTLLEKNYIIKL